MQLKILYERVYTLLREEDVLLSKDDPSLPQGKIGYRWVNRSYEKKDGTLSRYRYRRSYYAAPGKQIYLNQKEAARIAGVLAAREALCKIRAEMAAVVAEINRQLPAERQVLLTDIREMFQKSKEALDAVRAQSGGKKREIEYPCIAADGTVMRSRGEVIVANLLILLGMLYVYEPVFWTPTGKHSYRRPDFCVLTPKGIVYIEVMGMCSEMNYWLEQQEKLKEYREAGLEVGKNLLVIEVNDERKINSKIIYEQLQNLYLGIVPRTAVAA